MPEPGFAKEGRTRTLGIVLSAVGAPMSLAGNFRTRVPHFFRRFARRVGRSIDDHGWASKGTGG